MMGPLEEARRYLAQADQLREAPMHQSPWNDPGQNLKDMEARREAILQLHIRALVAVAPIFMQRAQGD